jgi:hypothetical protein
VKVKGQPGVHGTDLQGGDVSQVRNNSQNISVDLVH